MTQYAAQVSYGSFFFQTELMVEMYLKSLVKDNGKVLRIKLS